MGETEHTEGAKAEIDIGGCSRIHFEKVKIALKRGIKYISNNIREVAQVKESHSGREETRFIVFYTTPIRTKTRNKRDT